MTSKQDLIWKALSDPTRRSIMDALRPGPLATSEIVQRFPKLTRFGVMKHLETLREANLVKTTTVGRNRINQLRLPPLRQASRWLERFDSITDESPKAKKTATTPLRGKASRRR